MCHSAPAEGTRAAIYQAFVCSFNGKLDLLETWANLMKKSLPQLASEINLLNPNLIYFMHRGGICHLPTCVF